MNLKLAQLAVAASLCVMCSSAKAVSFSFDSDPGWTANANWPSTFGWSATSHAGGPVGEIGGVIDMAGITLPAYYGVSLGTVHNLNSTLLSASGRFAITSQSPWGALDFYAGIGFFNSASSGSNPQLGFQLAEHGNSTSAQSSATRAKVNLGLDGAASSINPNPAYKMATNYVGYYNFNFTYDPAIGNGRLTLNITDQDGNAVPSITGAAVAKTINLTAAQRAQGATFDSFGINIGKTGGMGFEEFWLDNLEYTAIIPEPSTLGLVALGLGGCLALRRRYRG
jgi:hypothetical protein